MWVRCLPSAQLKSEEEKRDTSRNRGPRAGAFFLFLFEILFPAVHDHTILPVRSPLKPSAACPRLLQRKEDAMSNAVESFAAQSLGPQCSVAKTTVGRRQALGLCWIIYGLARILLAVWLFLFQTTATVMFGALLTRVPNPFTLMDTFHLFYAVIVLYSIVCGVLGAIAGLALWTGWSSARAVALSAGFLALPEMPLGLMLGVYTIVRLLPFERQRAPAV